MAVESFIPMGDVKISTEKPVKQKPTIEELTTVETPGRPFPARNLENKRAGAKKKRAPAKPKAPKNAISKTRDTILIITEKPQAAQKIADALGDAKKYTEDGVSFYELERNGQRIAVASAVGHLFSLTYVKGQKGWPIFELEWQPSYNIKSSAFTKKYYNLIKKLSNRAKEYVIATDFDVEGEVIGWNVLRFICGQNTAKRMKYSTLTKPELEKSYDNLMPQPNWGNAYAGETRHMLDWLYGINFSRALMSAIKTTGSFKILSIGRVQGPALKIIVDREKEIGSFKPEPFWRVFAMVQGVSLQHPEDIFDKKLLEKFKGLTEGIAETKKSEEHIAPGHPFDLTTLQREAYRVHHFSPSQTLKIAQQLYLEGIISYPRTSSQKIPPEIEPKKILKKLEKKFPEVKQATRDKPIEGKKSDPAHPSIYPTGEIKVLKEEEEKLYTLIAKRFIAAFSPDAITANKKIILICRDNIKFTTSGAMIVEKGWIEFYPYKIEELNLPDINGNVKIDEIKIEEKETQPPKRFTPTSLITILEKKNLGTKATRSMIVDTLFDRGYLDGTSIKATPLGMKLIDALSKYSPIIIDENLTRQFEEELEKMQEDIGKSSKTEDTNRIAPNKEFEKKEKEIVAKTRELITNISVEFKIKEAEIGKELQIGIGETREVQKEASTIMTCPTCKKGMLRIMFSKKSRRYFVACSAYPDCRQTYSLPPNSLIKKTDKVSENGLPILMALRKGKRPWLFPFNPNWKEEQGKSPEQAPKEETFKEMPGKPVEDEKEDKVEGFGDSEEEDSE